MRHLLPAALIGSLTVVLTAPAAHSAVSPESAAPIRVEGSRTSTAPLSAAKTAVDDTHVVRHGDTVSAIAAQHGLRVADVLRWNDLSWSSLIFPGQTLKLSGSSAPSDPASSSPSTEASPDASTTAASTHTVSAGDTIYAIANRYGTTVSAVLTANGLNRSSVIYPGQTIALPGAMSVPLNAPQTENARLIISIGRDLGVPERGIAIALGTAMQESWLRNLDWGDRDSVGLFQQRPSTGWGSPAQIQDRGYAIRAFFGGPGDPSGTGTRGLLDIPGWSSMSFADAAQAVQISAFPDRYAPWETPAYEWLSALG